MHYVDQLSHLMEIQYMSLYCPCTVWILHSCLELGLPNIPNISFVYPLNWGKVPKIGHTPCRTQKNYFLHYNSQNHKFCFPSCLGPGHLTVTRAWQWKADILVWVVYTVLGWRFKSLFMCLRRRNSNILSFKRTKDFPSESTTFVQIIQNMQIHALFHEVLKF